MQFFNRFFQFYIFSNIHVALGAFCLVKITLLPYDIVENNTALFVFFSTIIAYNFIRFFRILEVVKWFSDWLNNNKKTLYILTFLSILAVVFLIFKMQLKALLWLLPFSLFTLFYVVPLPFKNKSLRKISGIKLFLIAFSYAGITVLFPLVQNDILITTNVWITFVQRFIFIVLIAIPFDIRDLHCDNESLKTLPQMIGVKNAKRIGIIFGLLFVLAEFLKFPIVVRGIIIVLIVSVLSSLFLINSKEIQSKYYSSFWVEAIPIFWFLLFYILK